MANRKRKLKFVDLFAGLGGFHVGLSKLGHKCIYACEIDQRLNEYYGKNFRLKKEFIWDDIKTIPKKHLTHIKENADMICAGFPCQPFSKAGTQSGFNHKIAGDMFNELYEVIKFTKPEYLFLENVPNLVKHNHGKTYRLMKRKLEKLDYTVKETILAPTDFNFPQTRNRLYIFGIHRKKNKKHNDFNFPVSQRNSKDLTSPMGTFLLKNKQVKYLELHKAKKIEMYQDLLNMLRDKIGVKEASQTLVTPLWTMEFNANYPINQKTYKNKNLNNFIGYKGTFGKKIKLQNGVITNLPAYAMTGREFPQWKINFIEKNRAFLKQHKDVFSHWIKKYRIDDQFPSYQKFEWNAHGENINLKQKLISFRPSGIRVTRVNSSPTLIAQTTSQLPLVGSGSNKVSEKYRFITHKEALRLQGFNQSDLKYINKFRSYFFPAIGNAVNVHMVKRIAKQIG